MNASRHVSGDPAHGNGTGHPHRPTKERPAPDAGSFGMTVFLVSLAMLFLGSIAAYLAVRSQAEVWPPAGLPPLPQTLGLSTFLIVLGSVTVQASVHFAKAGRRLLLRTALLATLLLGLAFLAAQTLSWVDLIGQRTTMRSDLFGWLFYFLTGLHGLHVLGGLVPLTVVTVNSCYDRYSPLRNGPVRFSAVYWHFLGAVWITLYGMLVLTV